MRKSIFYLQASLLLVASCVQSETANQDYNGSFEQSVNEIVAVMPQVVNEDGVRSSLSFDGTKLTTVWSTNDKLGFWPKESEYGLAEKPGQSIFYVKNGGSTTATFTANGWGLLTGKTYYSYYPYSSEASSNSVKVDFTGQNQTGNGNLAHLSEKDVLWGMRSNLQVGDNIKYERLAAIAQFNLTLPEASTSVNSMTLSFGENLFTTNASFNPCSDTKPSLSAGDKSSEMTVSLSDVASGLDKKVVVYAMMFPTEWGGKTINVKVTGSDNAEYTGTINPGYDQSPGDFRTYSAELKAGNTEPQTKTFGGQTYTNLSYDGYANCYIVPQSGYYCFNVTKKGNGEETFLLTQIGDAGKVYDSGAGVGGLCLNDNYAYSDGYAYFQANNQAGNVVFFVRKDGNSNILWSWHLWCLGGGTQPEATKIGDYYIMNCNLGATVHNSNKGCTYQWGRKDPFPGPGQSKGNDALPILKYSVVGKNANTGTIDYTNSQPLKMVRPSNGKGHWINTDDTALWGTAKTMYDPCPAGYKVLDDKFDPTKISGWEIFGWIDGEDITYSNPGSANYWTTTCYKTTVANVENVPVGKTFNSNGASWALGICHAFAACPVRCQKIQ